jgi:hypothetical protein
MEGRKNIIDDEPILGEFWPLKVHFLESFSLSKCLYQVNPLHTNMLSIYGYYDNRDI